MTCKERIHHFNDFVVGRFSETTIKAITRQTGVTEGDVMELLHARKLWADVLACSFELLAVQPGKQLVPFKEY